MKILAEVFGLEDGEYRRRNAFWSAYSLAELARSVGAGDEVADRISELKATYDDLSTTYQASKGTADIPLS